MAKNKNQKIHFSNLEFEKLSIKKLTLEKLLDLYIEEAKNNEQVLLKNEKSVLLLESNKNGDFIHLKFEIIKYGEKRDIKDRAKNYSTISTLDKNQYVQELQYIVLKKISDDNYDIAIQKKQGGITYIKLYNLLRDFYLLKKPHIEESNSEGYSDTEIRVRVYRTADFFKKLEKITANSIHIVGSALRNDDDPDLFFSDKTNYTKKVEIRVREKKGAIKFLDKHMSLSDFIKKQLILYPDARLTINGINQSGVDEKIFSGDVDHQTDIKVEINIHGQLNEVDIIEKMESSIEKMHSKSSNIVRI